jgi:hypothetical protein
VGNKNPRRFHKMQDEHQESATTISVKADKLSRRLHLSTAARVSSATTTAPSPPSSLEKLKTAVIDGVVGERPRGPAVARAGSGQPPDDGPPDRDPPDPDLPAGDDGEEEEDQPSEWDLLRAEVDRLGGVIRGYFGAASPQWRTFLARAQQAVVTRRQSGDEAGEAALRVLLVDGNEWLHDDANPGSLSSRYEGLRLEIARLRDELGDLVHDQDIDDWKRRLTQLDQLESDRGAAEAGIFADAARATSRLAALQLVFNKARAEIADRLLAEANRAVQQADQGFDPEAFLVQVCDSRWETAKDLLLVQDGSPDGRAKMRMLWGLRQQIVDQILASMNKARPDLLLSASGSTDLTSDYDIVLSTNSGRHGDVITMVRQFNELIRQRLIREPGTALDTNLYVKNFVEVEDTFAARGTDQDPLARITSFQATDRSNQDVAALMKLRRYMNQAEWDAFVAGATPTSGDVEANRIQFEEAEARFLVAQKTWVERLLADRVALAAALPREEGRVVRAQLESLLDQRPDDLAQAAAWLQRVASFLEDKADDHVLRVKYDLYLEGMDEAHRMRERYQALEAMLAQDPLVLTAPPLRHDELARLNAAADARGELEKIVGVLKTESKKQISDSTVFAPEAYQSEGPMKQVVQAGQANDPRILNSMSAEQFLQSLNEQFADFLKDVHHYGQKPPGVAIYQTSKYLKRMLEARDLIANRLSAYQVTMNFGGNVLATSPPSAVDELLKMRKAKAPYDNMTPDQRRQAATAEATNRFGAGTIGGLVQLVTDMNRKINKSVRAAVVDWRPA